MKSFLICLFSLLISTSVFANDLVNDLDELDPASPNIEETLKAMDKQYEETFGISPFINANDDKSECFRNSCTVWARVSKDEQKLYLYINGALDKTWPVSTGKTFHSTPDFDQHPNGRLYDAHSSSKYPGGSYKGLGNMPYSVFIDGGYAIHGTTEGNFSMLGQKASHGCVRLHPDNAKIFITLVRQYGIRDVWITIE